MVHQTLLLKCHGHRALSIVLVLLCRDTSGMPQVNTQTVIAALERNFGGNSAQEFQTIAAAFLEHLRSACGSDAFPEPQPDMYRNTLDVLKNSLVDRHISGEHLGHQQASLSNVAARPILVIDQTGQPLKDPFFVWQVLVCSHVVTAV